MRTSRITQSTRISLESGPEPDPVQTVNTFSLLADDQQVYNVSHVTGSYMGDNNADFLQDFAHNVEVGKKFPQKITRSSPRPAKPVTVKPEKELNMGPIDHFMNALPKDGVLSTALPSYAQETRRRSRRAKCGDG